MTCFSARICLLREAAGEGQSRGGPTSPWGVTASPATRRGEWHPRRDAGGVGGTQRGTAPHPIPPIPVRMLPPSRASVSPAGSCPAEQPGDARTDGRQRRRGTAGERRCSGPAGAEAPILSPGWSGRTGLELGWGSGTARLGSARGAGELPARCPAPHPRSPGKSLRDHELAERRLGPRGSAEHHTGGALPPAPCPCASLLIPQDRWKSVSRPGLGLEVGVMMGL